MWLVLQNCAAPARAESGHQFDAEWEQQSQAMAHVAWLDRDPGEGDRGSAHFGLRIYALTHRRGAKPTLAGEAISDALVFKHLGDARRSHERLHHREVEPAPTSEAARPDTDKTSKS